MKQQIINLLNERSYITLSELSRLLHKSESDTLQLVFQLQEDKLPIVIDKGEVYFMKDNIWMYLTGVMGVVIIGLLFIANW